MSWRKESDRGIIDVTIPPNIKGGVYLSTLGWTNAPVTLDGKLSSPTFSGDGFSKFDISDGAHHLELRKQKAKK